jgi:hypothetical protein
MDAGPQFEGRGALSSDPKSLEKMMNTCMKTYFLVV